MNTDLHTLRYSEMDVRHMLDAAICTLLRNQLNGEMKDWSWDDISSVISSQVLHDA